MIDENCVIWKEGKGLCWCPSSGWGLKDEELCQLCLIKNAEIIEKIEIINPRLAKVQVAKRRVDSASVPANRSEVQDVRVSVYR